ncbi:hypothetical protein PAXRUDRAFT_178853, partial [Paxillus rubicundulus Ve08.2h10]
SNCMAFAAHHFQLTLSTSFLQALIFNTFIEGATLLSSIPFSLENSFQMGQYMDVLLFSLTKAPSPLSCRNFTCNKFIWWSKQTRPYRTSLPLSCPVCGPLWCWDQPVWSASVGEGSWSVACENPRCSLDGKGVQFIQCGALSGVQPEGSHFITAKKRPSGWMVVMLLDEEIMWFKFLFIFACQLIYFHIAPAARETQSNVTCNDSFLTGDHMNSF